MSHQQKEDIFDRQAGGQNLADIARSLSFLGADGVLKTSGNRLRTASSKTLLSTRFAYDEQPFIFQTLENVNGSVDYIAERDAVDLTIGGAAGDKVVRSSNEFFHYQSYRETQFGQGFRFPDHVDGLRCRLGGFFTEDGAFLERDESGTLNIVRRSNASGSATEERVPQSDWNVNTFFESDNHIKNPSGIVLNDSMTQMLKIGLLWYGAGYIYVGFQFGQEIYIAHVFQGANVRQLPILGEPTVPLRWEIENVSATGQSSTLSTYGASATIEAGEFEDVGFVHSISSRNTGIATQTESNQFVRLLTIRPSAIFKGKTNRTKVEPLIFGVYFEAEPHDIILARDVPMDNEGTANWQPVGDESAVEYALDVVGNNLDEGVSRLEDFAPADNKGGGKANVNADTRNPLVVNAGGGLGETNLAIFARSKTNSTDVGYGSMQWLEIQ